MNLFLLYLKILISPLYNLSHSIILLVETHVAFQYVLNWSKQPLETVSVKCHHLKLSHCYDVSCSWLVLDQGSLSKVVSRTVLEDFNRRFSRLQGLCSDGFTTHDEVENLAVFSFINDKVFWLEPELLESVSEL